MYILVKQVSVIFYHSGEFLTKKLLKHNSKTRYKCKNIEMEVLKGEKHLLNCVTNTPSLIKGKLVE